MKQNHKKGKKMNYLPGQGHSHICPELMAGNPPGKTAKCTEKLQGKFILALDR